MLAGSVCNLIELVLPDSPFFMQNKTKEILNYGQSICFSYYLRVSRRDAVSGKGRKIVDNFEEAKAIQKFFLVMTSQDKFNVLHRGGRC